MWDLEAPVMKPTWRVASIVNGTTETQTVTFVGGPAKADASQSGTISYSASQGGQTLTVTIGEVRGENFQYIGSRSAEIGSSVVSGIADAFVMIPHHSSMVSCWKSDFNKVAADFNKVVVRAHERSEKQR